MGVVRVTGGIYRGRVIEVPTGPLDIRPAMDRMRESLFSILGDLSGRSFLDLFSGSGIMALEAASRGAAPIECVERDRSKLPTLIRNVSIAKERIECHCMPVERFIRRAKGYAFSVVFCDPPFPYEFRRALVQDAAAAGLVAPGGLLLMHYPSEDGLDDAAGDLVSFDEREYGRSRVRFYRREENPASGPATA